MPATKDKPGLSVQKRTRSFAPKVVTGCITCKIRRIKCDEAKPNCLKCVNTGRKCDGYLTPNSFEGRKAAPGTPAPKLQTCADRLLSLDISGNAQERGCFDFFRSCTVLHLSGFDTSLWQQLILQASHREPAIKHAAIALGSLHQKFSFEQSTDFQLNQSSNYDKFALEQYVKALGYLVQPIQNRGKQAADVALITCVLFVCFETLRGHHGAALSHIESGVKIVAELNAEKEGFQCSKTSLEVVSNAYVPLRRLNLVFIRLDSQAAQLGPNRVRKLLSPRLDNEERGYQAGTPLAFCSIEEAKNALDHVWTECDRVLEKEKLADELGGPNPSHEMSLKIARDYSSTRLRAWSQAFDNFVRQDPQEFEQQEQEMIHILKIHCILMGIFFTIEFVLANIDETFWDYYYVEFDAILTHVDSVVKISRSPRSKGMKAPTFSLDTGIVLPLYFVATKCRHPTIRCKSIAFLKSINRQEGVLNSTLAGRVAERLAEIEEQGLGEVSCAEDIPNWARLSGVIIKFDTEGRRAFLQYMRHSWEGSKRDTVEEWLQW